MHTMHTYQCTKTCNTIHTINKKHAYTSRMLFVMGHSPLHNSFYTPPPPHTHTHIPHNTCSLSGSTQCSTCTGACQAISLESRDCWNRVSKIGQQSISTPSTPNKQSHSIPDTCMGSGACDYIILYIHSTSSHDLHVGYMHGLVAEYITRVMCTGTDSLRSDQQLYAESFSNHMKHPFV